MTENERFGLVFVKIGTQTARQDGSKAEDKIETRQKDKKGPYHKSRWEPRQKIIIVPRQEDEMAPRQEGPIRYTNTRSSIKLGKERNDNTDIHTERSFKYRKSQDKKDI